MPIIDLNQLPAPDVVEELDFETILAERKATLISLYPEDQQEAVARTLTLDELTTRLAEGLREAAEEAGIPLVVNHVGGMFGIFFTDAESVTCYQDVMACDVERFKRFFHMMLDEGVYLAPSAFEAGFMSVAHSMEDINNTIDAARRVFAKL